MGSDKDDNSRALDQFYTKPEVAKICIEFLKQNVLPQNRCIFLEPSCGTGSFSLNLENCVSVDLDPKIENAKKGDFLTLSKTELNISHENLEVCTVGNPPFGPVCSLAVNFFNHAATMSDTICFILPRSFKKVSIQKRINKEFHLLAEKGISENSFIHKGLDYDVPCVFQIWQRRKGDIRQISESRESEFFEFVQADGAQASVRRVGVNAGKASRDTFKSKTSHYFIKLKDDKLSIDKVIEKINSLDFPEKHNTSGPLSISKAELVALIDPALKAMNEAAQIS